MANPVEITLSKNSHILKQVDEDEDEAIGLTLDHAVELALSENPGLAELNARASALSEVPPQVGTMPDPTLTLSTLNLPVDTFSLSQEAMTQVPQVGISFELPFPGKLGLREEAASFDAKSAEFDVDEMRLALIRNVHIVWWNLFFLDQALGIVQRNQDLLRQFIQVAESKYRTGQGIQPDVLLGQVELSKLLEIEIDLKASRQNESAALNALLDRSAAKKVILSKVLNKSLPPVPNIEPLRKIALDTRPVLFSLRSTVEAARTRVELAKKDYYPDFKLGANYGFRSGSNQNGSSRADFTSIMFSMNLPIFTDTKQDRALVQRKQNLIKQEYGLQDQVLQIDKEVEQAFADYRSSYEKASLFKTGIIPQAEQTTASMLAAYRVSKVDFLNLIRSQITLYNYQTQYWKAFSSGWQAWSKLEFAIGKTIPTTIANDIMIINKKSDIKMNEEKIHE